MLGKLLSNQRSYLNYFFDTFLVKEAEAVFEKVKNISGSLVITGVGKSGHIGQKITATLVSTGTKAFFLSPSNALHGDIGLLSPNDTVLFFSKSGESEELISLIPHIQKRGAFQIAVVSSHGSRLEKGVDLTVHLPLKRELCPYDLAPTTSTALQLIFGDCLAIALMQERQFSISSFAENHPAGLLGRKITFKVFDLMLKGEAIPRCSPKEKLIDLLHELSAKRCGCLLIAEEDRLLGIFTDGDLRRSIEQEGASALQRPIFELMTPNPRTISPNHLAFSAIEKMEEDPSKLITVLPVVEEGRLVGLLKMHDILQKVSGK